MNAALPAPQPGTSAFRLARLLDRRECVFLPSPSLALLSVFVAGPSRPSRLLVQRGAPAFVANVGRISGAVSEFLPDEDGEELRAHLRSVTSGETGIWAVAIHDPARPTPPEWFAACDSRGVGTIELVHGGLFDLARRGRSAAAATIVSLDHEPAFEGVRLSALLTDDRDLAQRVRQMCLPGSNARDFVLDAAPRGLSEDEEALRSLIERAIARDQAGAPPVSVEARPSKKSFSLAWKRVFKSEAEASPESTREEAGPLALPRGKSSWLARMADLEKRQEESVREARLATEAERARWAEQVARLESALLDSRRQHEEAQALWEERTRELQAEAEQSRRQADLEVADRNAEQVEAKERTQAELTSLREELGALQAQEALSKRKHEAAQDQLESRLHEVSKERDSLQGQLKSVVAERQRDAALQTVAVATAEKSRLALAARADELEEVAIKAQARIATLEEQAAELTLLSAAAATAREAAAEKLLQDAELHKDTLRLAEERETTLRQTQMEETARLNSLVSDWQTRFDAASRIAAKEAQRRESQHAAQMTRLQDEVAQLRQQKEATAQADSQNAVAVSGRISELERGNAVLVAERDALVSRMAAAEAASRESLSRAEEQVERLQREKTEETARFTVTQAEGQSRLDAAAVEWARQTEAARQERAESVKQLEAELVRVNGVAAGVQARLDASTSLAAKEAERAEKHHAEVVSKLEGDLARANGVVAEWQKRFDASSASAAQDAERAEKHHAEVVSKLEGDLVRANGVVAEWQKRFDASSASAAQDAERAEKRHAEVVSKLEGDLVRANGVAAEWQKRFDASAASAAQDAERAEKRHAEALKQLKGEMDRLREQAETALRRQEQIGSESSDRIAQLEKESAALSGERDAAELRLAQSEQRSREASQRFDERFATIERDKAEEISRLSAGLALGQARFDAAGLAAAHDARAREAEHLERVAGLQSEFREARAESEAKNQQLVGELAAFEKRIAVLETEKTAVVAERDDLAARLDQAQRASQRAEQAAKGRIAALERAHLKESASLTKTVSSWQARFETATRNATRDSQRVELRNATLVTRLQEKAAQLKKQAGGAIRDQVREAAAFGKRLSVLERERDAASNERDQVVLRLLEMTEETARLTSQIGEWQARFDAASLAAATESDRLEARHAALAARVQEDLARARNQTEAIAIERDAAMATLQSRLSQVDRERIAALQARDEEEARFRQQEEKHAQSLIASETNTRLRLEERAEDVSRLKAQLADWEARWSQQEAKSADLLKRTEEKSRRLQEEASDEAKRLLGVAIEWQSRFDAAAAKHEQDQVETRERFLALERERAEALRGRDALEARGLEREEKHTEIVRASEERNRRLEQEKADETKRLASAVAEWQGRFDAAAAKQAQDQADLKERLAVLEKERVKALKELDQLRTEARAEDDRYHAILQAAEDRSREAQETLAGETARLNAALSEWQSRFDAAARTTEKDSSQLIAAHDALVARLREEVAELSRGKDAPNEAQAANVAALNAQLSALKRAKTAAEEERKLIEVRLNQAGEAQRQALRRVEVAHEEKAAEVVRLRESIRDWQARFDAASQAQAASTAALLERLKAMEKDKATASTEWERAAQRLRKLEDAHREALQSVEASRVEALSRLRSKEAHLAEVLATRSAGSEAAEVAAANLRAALEARALESVAHAKALETWEAHRATLEARIASLEKGQSSFSASVRHPPADAPVRNTPVDEAPDDALPPKAARAKENEAPLAKGPADRRPGPKLVPWEYERILKGEREEKRSAVEDWRRSPPPRPSRD